MSDTEIITDEPLQGGRRISPILIALLVLVALVGIYFVGVRPLLAGDPDAGAALPAAETTEAVDPEPAGDGVEDEVTTLPIVTYEVFLDRDPFDPVVPEPVVETVPVADGSAADGATDGTATDGTSTDGTSTDGTATDGATDGTATDGGTTDGGAEQPTGCRGEDTVTCDGRIVSLVEVRGGGSDALAIVQVDSTLYEVTVGETFAGSFQLRSIAGQCVTVLYGDDAFELCQGDRVLK